MKRTLTNLGEMHVSHCLREPSRTSNREEVMIKLTTLCPNIATVFSIWVLLTGVAFSQKPVSILQNNSHAESLPILAAPEEQSFDDQGFDDPSFEDLNVLTRGPLHEAFASAHQSDPQSSTLIHQAPPQLIDELPPEYKPEGNNVQWISGYWAWDDAQSDFIWISGIWRDVPPNRRWMPGYWDAEGNAHRWVSGFWIEEAQHELAYLPTPPASIDQGPSTISPSAEHFYVPGNWQFHDDRYRWLSGHWQPVVENQIWVPARHVWTPNGCVYQSGYWDYEFEDRGTCFAPVHFTQPVYLANNYSYRPSYAINLNIDFMTHLFVRAGCDHYFYGDWYASNFNNLGYRPWVSYTSHFRNYDPLLAYYSSRRSSFNNRYNVVQYLARQHNFYINNRDYRPRPTYKAQHKHARNVQQRNGGRAYGKDYILRSSYVSAYKDFRKQGEKRSDIRYQPGQQKHNIKKHRKVAEVESRNNRRKQQQLAELQRDRKRREHAGQNRVATISSAKNRTQSIASSRQREQDRLRKAQDKSRQTATNAQRRSYQTKHRTETVKRQSRSNQATQLDQARRAQQQARRSQQERERRSQQERERRTQQEKVRRSQQEIARKSAARKAQQDSDRRAQQQKAKRAQQDQARKAQQAAARRAQQDQARRAQQDAARKSQQDRARRAQQDRARQQVAQRDRQQKSQRDSAARKAKQKAQQNAAKRAQKSRQAAKKKAPQESRSSRLRNRSQRK